MKCVYFSRQETLSNICSCACLQILYISIIKVLIESNEWSLGKFKLLLDFVKLNARAHVVYDSIELK